MNWTQTVQPNLTTSALFGCIPTPPALSDLMGAGSLFLVSGSIFIFQVILLFSDSLVIYITDLTA